MDGYAVFCMFNGFEFLDVRLDGESYRVADQTIHTFKTEDRATDFALNVLSALGLVERSNGKWFVCEEGVVHGPAPSDVLSAAQDSLEPLEFVHVYPCSINDALTPNP